MSQRHENLDVQDSSTKTINRRHAIGRVAAVSAAGVVAGSLAMPAWATSSSDPRLRTYEGKYAIDGHKIIEGYFATPRGKTGMDVLVVIPGPNGLDDSVRDLVRRHALAGKIAIAPDLAKTAGTSLTNRDAMIADLISHTPRLKRHSRGNGTVTVVAA